MVTTKESSSQTPIQITLRKALRTVSELSAASGNVVLFEDAVRDIQSTKESEYHDVKAKRLSLEAISTYHKLVQLASESTQFDNVLQSAKRHVSETLQKWSESEYEYTLAQLSLDFNLFSLDSEAVKKTLKQKIANNELELWIRREQLRQNQMRKQSSDSLLDHFLRQQPEEYLEEDETIKMISWFSIVYRAYGHKKMIHGKILCDIAHPNTVPETIQKGDYIFQFLDRLTTDSQTLVRYIERLETHKEVDSDEARELLRVYVMGLWKTVRCFKLAAFTSDVMLEMMTLPAYDGEDIWTHETQDEWPLGVRVRDSPVIETITIAMIVVVGLLCASAPMAKILLTPDVFALKRAAEMVKKFREDHLQVIEKGNVNI